MSSTTADPVEAEFTVTAEVTAGTLTIVVSGELDMATAPQLNELAAANAGHTGVVIDLRGCTFIDSSGIRELLNLRAASAPRPVRLTGITDNVQRTFDVAGVTPIFTAS